MDPVKSTSEKKEDFKGYFDFPYPDETIAENKCMNPSLNKQPTTDYEHAPTPVTRTDIKSTPK